MSTSIRTIQSSLKTLISANLASLSEFSEFAADSFATYPAGFIRFVGVSSINRANTKRLFTYRYQVKIFVEQGTNNEASAAERIIGELGDELITTLNANVTLNQSVLDVRPVDFTTDFESNDTDARVLEGIIEVEKFENISN